MSEDPAAATGAEEDEAVVSFDFDDDDDEFADLFSFATAPSESSAMSPSKSSSSSPSKQAVDYRQAMASVMPLPPSHDDDEGSEQSGDSFLDLLEQQKEPLTILDAAAAATTSSSKTKTTNDPSDDLDIGEANMQEMLDWLDQDDDDQEAARQQLEEEEVFLPPSLRQTSSQEEEESSVPALAPEPEPQFKTLEEAVKSPKSSLAQIRNLLTEEHFQVAASVRPHLWCRVVCGKTLEDTLQSSVADSFQQWEKHSQALLHGPDRDDSSGPSPTASTPSKEETAPIIASSDENKNEKDVETSSQPSAENTQESSSSSSSSPPSSSAPVVKEATTTETKTLTPFQQAQREWILEQSNMLSNRIVTVLKGEKLQSQQALASLLLNHYHTGQEPIDDDDEEKLVSSGGGEVKGDAPQDSSSSARTPDYQDPLLPPVACAILSAGVPKTAAAVMLSHIVPHFMPILALTRKEREQAAQLLHRQFHLLACYHLPSLVLHLDRYLPNWFFWPDFGAKKKDGQGFVPQSYLVSHLAGECNNSDDNQTFLLNPRWILALWDLILTSSNNSLRFFLVLAVLESHADQLVLLTDDALKEKLVQVLRFQQEDSSGVFAIQDSEAQTTNQDAIKWVQEWTDKAQSLWERTPLSVSRRLKRVEDQVVTEALTKRQQEAEEKMKRKLEAQAKAHQEAIEAERERKAEEARLRLTRARLVAFYRQYSPAKETNIDKIMETYQGRYEVLDSKLKQKYGVGFNPALKPKVAPPRSTVSNPTSRPQGREDEDELATKRKRHQLVVKVGPTEVLPEVCWSKKANKVRMFKLDRGNKLEENTETRLPLKFYLVDSRPVETARDQGRFPISVSFPPEDLTDPDRLKQQEDMFEGLRGAIHIVIMGEGFAALPSLYGHKMTDGLTECIREDDARNNNCALFFLKKGFPFVSTLDGGFAAAHAFLSRQGANYHLRVNDVLADYNPEVSIFGQFERVHNSTGREKAQRALQNIFDSSLVALTKNTRRFETLASEVGGDDKQQQKKGGNMVSRFFSGGISEDTKKNNPTENSEHISEVPASENENKGVPSGPVFRNPFARKQSSKLNRESSNSSLDVESIDDLDTDSGHDTTDNKGTPKPAAETKQVPNSTKPAEQKAQAPVQPKPVEQRKNPEPPKANPFAGIGAAFKAASKAAAGDTGNKGRVINPFARFNQQGRNLGNSQHGGGVLGTSRHGLGGSRHGMGLGGSRHGLGNSKHGQTTEGQVPGIGMAKNLAGFNQLRKNAFSRVRSSGDSAEDSSFVSDDHIREEAVSFDQTSSAIASSEPEQRSATTEEEVPPSNLLDAGVSYDTAGTSAPSEKPTGNNKDATVPKSASVERV